MIISIRGTNGAGKSTLVRNVMRHYVEVQPDYRVGRRKPVGYLLDKKLFVIGHYEIANGGIDTLKTLDEAYALAQEYAIKGYDVLMEGKNLSDTPRRLLALRNLTKIRVVTLSPALEHCVVSVRKRGHSISEETISKLHSKSRRDHYEFEKLGVICLMTRKRNEAKRQVCEWLNISFPYRKNSAALCSSYGVE